MMMTVGVKYWTNSCVNRRWNIAAMRHEGRDDQGESRGIHARPETATETRQIGEKILDKEFLPYSSDLQTFWTGTPPGLAPDQPDNECTYGRRTSPTT